MQKRIFLCIVFLCLLTVSVFAADGGSCGENATWKFSDGVLTISGSGEMDDYENGDTPWKEYDQEITRLIIDDRITHIGDESFGGCSQFESVTLPSNLETIGHRAFANCFALESIELPDSVRAIGSDAFAYTRIAHVVLPRNLENLWSGAFAACSRLKSFEVAAENDRYKVVDGVLYDRKLLRLYAYPAGKEDATFTVPETVCYLSDAAFQGCSNLQTVFLSEGIEKIGNFMFYGCSNLESLYIPDCLTEYGSVVFASKAAVTVYGKNGSKAEELAKEYGFAFSTEQVPVNTVDYTYKDGILTVHGEGAIRTYAQGKAPWYQHHMEAKELIIEEGITKIGFGAFRDFFYIEYVEIPASVTVLEEFFQNCESIRNYDVSEDSEDFFSEDGIIFSKDKTKIVRYPEGRKDAHYSIPDGVVEICDNAFNSALFETVDIPDSVKIIDNFAFLNCSRLTAVRVPDGVTELKTDSFHCKNLNGIYIPPTVKKITNTFGSTENLTIYGERGSYAEEYAKKKGIAFSTEEMPDTFFSWFFEDGVLTIKSIGEMERYGSYHNPAPWMIHQNEIKEVILCEGITTVGEHAFEQCRLLRKVTLPNSVTAIKSGAFAFCDLLSDINFPNGITVISSSAFYSCESLRKIELPKTLKKIYSDAFFGCGLQELILPDGLEYIGARAFAGCHGLTTVTVPASVTEIGDFAFGRGMLSAIRVEEDNPYFTSENGVLFNKDKTELINYPPGSDILVYHVPSSVVAIRNRAFCGILKYTSLVFDTKVQTVGDHIFDTKSIFVTVHADADNTVLQTAAEGHVNFIPIETDEAAAKPKRLYDVLVGLKNLSSSKQINTLLTQLQLLAE